MFFDRARYLIRFDDLCPTMDWAAWDPIEALLIEQQVQPILAVVPDNQDPYLEVGPAAQDFWARVRGWQARGWAIGLHGYRHTYVNQEAGLLGLNPFSEFAGLPLEAQSDKLSKGLAIFAQEGVRADVWIAPAHSFDRRTVQALKALGISIISDGMAFSPFQDPTGVTWVPQPFAHMRPMPWGVWTFCYHINGISPEGLATFERRLRQLGPRMISLQEAVAMGDRRRSSADRLLGLARQMVSLAQKIRRS